LLTFIDLAKVKSLPRYSPRQDFQNNNHNKRKKYFSDRRYGAQHVVAVQEDHSETGVSQM
jgi:hypothetical protein